MNASQPNLDITVNDSPVTKVETTEIATTSTPSSAMALIQAAVEKGLSAETLERLYALHERITDRWAATQFTKALAAFQDECPTIKRTGVHRGLKRQGTNDYHRYAQLEEDIMPVVSPLLFKHGFSISWNTDVLDNSIHVTCKLRHCDGHEATAGFGGPPDDRENRATAPIQKYGALETYCRRMSLIQVTGIITGDRDNDAAPGAKISTDQSLTIDSLIDDSGADKTRFLKYMKAESVESIPESEYNRAINCLNEKKRKAAE